MNDISEKVNKWYTDNYKIKSCSRFESFRLALTLLYDRFENPFIFETGTVRQENDFGAGYSTYIFGECISLFGGELLTVDNCEQHMNLCKRLTRHFSNNITYIINDSIKTIETFSDKIDLLYLDSCDCPIVGDATEAQKHNLSEFMMAESKLKPNTLILIDDVNFENGGKAKLTQEYLKNNGYSLIYTCQQSLWHKL